jgi:acyl carrier protein
MTPEAARAAVRWCLAAVKPQFDLSALEDDTPLLESRFITSFDLLELILYLEQARGAPITRDLLQPGSFRDVNTIARLFLGPVNTYLNRPAEADFSPGKAEGAPFSESK